MKSNEFEKMNQIIEEMAVSKANRESDIDNDIKATKDEIARHDAAMNEAAAVADVEAYNKAKADKDAVETRLAMLEKHRDAVSKTAGVSDEDAKAFVDSVHEIQDAALRKAYQATINGVEKALKAIVEAERLVSDGNDTLIDFDRRVLPLVDKDSSIHEILLRNKVLRDADALTRFRDKIECGFEMDYVKEAAENISERN